MESMIFMGYHVQNVMYPAGPIVLAATGGRHHKLTDDDLCLLQRLYECYEIVEVVHGAAAGADKAVDWWAECRQIPRTPFPADWSNGRGGGPARNSKMIKYVKGKPRGVLVALAGNDGTADCLAKGIKAGLMVIDARLGMT